MPVTPVADPREHAPMPVFPDHRHVSGKWHGGVYAIGNFDGLHVGHQALIRETIRIAAETGAPSAVLTFDPHPRELFDPSALPFRLATSARKTHELNARGTRLCLNQRFDPDFAALKPAEFVDYVLLRSLRAAHVVVGEDFRFGSRQSGNTELLHDLCSPRGIGITVIGQITVGGEVASSSLVRHRIAEGRISETMPLLGRPWSVTATPEISNGGLRFDLSGYTRIKAGTYEVRIDGMTRHAAVTGTDDRRQILSVPAMEGLHASDHTVIEFMSSSR
jgi:riboflavin kinase / FMN adenylyltransferase